ncbi:MAG: TadE family protein [Alphaproteobacteria bacterium]
MADRLKNWLKLCKQQDRGAAAVEFALVASTLLMLVFGASVYGFYFSVMLALDHAASEGARASLTAMNAAERSTIAQEQVDRVLNAYSGLINTDLIEQRIGPAADNPGLFEVELRYQFSATSFGQLSGIVPLPAEEPNVIATVSNGGY